MLPILIIGAGPAGSLAAALLARARQTVMLIDRHRFPRDKVCGECLSSQGIRVLQRAGLLDRLLDAGAVALTHFAIHSPSGKSARLLLPAPMLACSRWKMDQILLEAAAAAGAKLVLGARCEGIEPHPRLAARLRVLESNVITVVAARYILLADGKSSLLPPRPAPTGDLGIKAHFAAVAGPRDTVELFGLAGHYAGLAPIENGLWNLALSLPQERLSGRPNPDDLLDCMLRQNPSLRRRLRTACRIGPWLTSALPRYPVRPPWPAGVIPIGNAAAAIEPIGGEGMGLALLSAELAAEAILHGSSATQDDLRQQFQHLWRTRRAACRLAAICVSRPTLCNIATEILGGWDWMAGQFMRWMGKSPDLAAGTM